MSKKPFLANLGPYPVSLSLFILLILQKADVVKYTDEEYEKYLVDPVGTT